MSESRTTFTNWRLMFRITWVLRVLKYIDTSLNYGVQQMRGIESKIKKSLTSKGVACHSIYRMPDPEDVRVLLAFNSQKNPRLSTKKVARILNEIGVGEFEVPREFQRLSSAFLHLEVTMGARTETQVSPSAQ